MILVTVGTHNRGFDRLVRATDELAAQIEEPVVIQYGSAGFEPRHVARAFRFTSTDEMEELTSRARVIVTHAAAGALILALKHGKPLVVIPRLRKYQEVMNDHQFQLARALELQNRVIVVMQPAGESLLQAIRQAANLNATLPDNSLLVEALRRRLNHWEAEKRST